jgi:hypothetical protein
VRGGRAGPDRGQDRRAAATHELTDELRDANINFLMGFDLVEPVRKAILDLPETAWRPAIRQDGETREGAWVAEISDRLDLAGWPEGCRVIVRRERPHPGAQLSFTDHDGHRFLATLTDLDGDAVELERLHRARAGAEDRVRAAKQTGLDNLPFRDFDHNAVWLELSLIAQDLIAWTQLLALDGELAICEPKTLRYRLLHTAAASPSMPAKRPCACSAPGPGRASWRPRSRDWPRCHHPRAELARAAHTRPRLTAAARRRSACLVNRRPRCRRLRAKAKRPVPDHCRARRVDHGRRPLAHPHRCAY